MSHYVELYKTAVEVQEHFNDIEWRIRGLALTVATFALGAAGVAAQEGTRAGPISLGTLVVLLGLILWYAFYFVDRWWYHPLLKASVKQGTVLEKEIRASLPSAGMTAAITAGSKYSPGPVVRTLSRKREMHSDDKLAWFYKVGAATFILAAVGLQLATNATPASELQPSVTPPNSISQSPSPGAPRPIPPSQGSSSPTPTP